PAFTFERSPSLFKAERRCPLRLRLHCRSSMISAVTDLSDKVYEELRGLARARLAAENPGHTLQATALVHEAWLKLMHHPGAASAASKAAFFAAAAQVMRQILVDHARGKSK